jgi:hypothetical protein
MRLSCQFSFRTARRFGRTVDEEADHSVKRPGGYSTLTPARLTLPTLLATRVKGIFRLIYTCLFSKGIKVC